MKKHLSVYLSLGLITAWPVIGQGFTDSFIRDGVKPKDLDHLTEKARTGRTHLSGFGSGFFITKDGYILTNCHVVEDAVEIVVLHGGTAYQANVTAKNKERDLALLETDGLDIEVMLKRIGGDDEVVPCQAFVEGTADTRVDH